MLLFWIMLLILASCVPQSETMPPEPVPSSLPPASWWRLAPGLTWQWQLDEAVDTTVDAEVYDVDLYVDQAVIDELHARGVKVICYISVGSWEDWRHDAQQFPPEVLGKDYEGWPGERWLDIRRLDLLEPVMAARLRLCRDKGFDAVEPDNIDGYGNDTGFPITYDDQLRYNRWLASEAHALGLSIGLKNDPEQAGDLVSDFDWALTEDCFDQGWCESMSPFLLAGKAVFVAEYTDTGVDFDRACAELPKSGFSLIMKDRDLTAWRDDCRDGP